MPMSIQRLSPALVVALSVVLISLFAGCAVLQGEGMARPRKVTRSTQVRELIQGVKPNNEIQKIVKRGLTELCINNDPQKAAERFKAGLRLNPADGNLHFLNALSLHMMSLSGDMRTLNMAESGYLTALRFDSANHIAAYLLGHLYFSQNQFDKAQEQFAYALIYDPQNLQALHALSAAAYYNQDLPLFGWAAKKACEVNPDSRQSIRALLFSKAITGKKGKNQELLKRYQDIALAFPKSRRARQEAIFNDGVSKRLNDWNQYHHLAGIFDADSTTDDIIGGGSAESDDSSDDEVDSDQGADDTATETVSSSAAQDGGKPASKIKVPNMALIDVVIIRTEEARSQAKGINLMDGLRTTLGGTLYGYTFNDAVTKTFNKTPSGGTSTSTFSKQAHQSSTSYMAPTLSLNGLEYNLNIFNDKSNRAEILARPSLLATEGETSKFFSGSELQVQLSSNNTDGSMVDKQIGIHLEVTPKFYGTERIRVTVHASKAFLEPISEEIGFTSFTQTAKTSVDATAVLKFGETLVLSGLSENESERTRDGVPILQSIPGVQYFFSRKEESETRKSILILLTPRKAKYMDDTASIENRVDSVLREHASASRYSSELKKREGIGSNIDSVLYRLAGRNDFYRQFRRGDLNIKTWNNEDTVLGAVKRSLGFLYY